MSLNHSLIWIHPKTKRGAPWAETLFQSRESETETIWDTEVWSSLGLPSLGRSSKQADVTLKGATTSYVGATIPYSCVGSPRDRVGWCWQAGDSKFLPLKMLSASLNSSPSLHINNKGKGIMRRSGDGSLWSHFSSLFRQLHRKRSLVSKIKTFQSICWLLSDPSPIIALPCQSLSHWPLLNFV